MKNYELLTVFKPSLDSEELDKVVEKIAEEITSYQGSVVSIDKTIFNVIEPIKIVFCQVFQVL